MVANVIDEKEQHETILYEKGDVLGYDDGDWHYQTWKIDFA